MRQCRKGLKSGLSLLQLGRRAGVLELLLDRRGLVLADVLLDRLGRAVDQVLRLLEAKTGDLADRLDDVDLRAPASLRMTLNSVFSSTASAAAPPPPAPPPAAATATGAAETPQRSWRNLPNCAISRIEDPRCP